MTFSKQEVKEGLESSKNIEMVHDWYPERNRLVFEPKGYQHKTFSMRDETLNSIHGMGWKVVVFYDGFVEIEEREETKAQKKLEEIKDIL